MKTVTAPNMAQALSMVKRTLGPDAVILHTRSYKRGGWLGFGGKMVVEVTATDEGRPTPRRPANRAAPAPVAASHAGPAAGELIRRTYAAARAELNQPEPGQAAVATRPAPPIAPTAPPARTLEPELADELRSVRRLVERVMCEQKRQLGPASRDLPDTLFDHYLALLKQEVAEELADEVMGQVRAALTQEQLTDAVAVRAAVQKALASLIPADDHADAPAVSTSGRPRVIALIGPTGVGKTTTIAKLAATFKLKRALHVGLITLDTYRIAAVDQLRTYADIIGVPLHVVNSPQEMRSAINKCRGCDVVLIDTAGRSQRDDPKLDQLKTFLQAAEPDEVHLVLSSTASQRVLLEAAERFTAVRADRIIFTKLDEAVTFGVLVNVARQVGKRLSYVTTGQEVPHQIEPGESARLASLVLAGELER